MPSATLPVDNNNPASSSPDESPPEFLTRPELIRRRAQRARQLASIYREHYWALMEELRYKYREYCWEFRKTPFVEDQVETEAENVNSNYNSNNCVGVGGVGGGDSGVVKCCVNGCKAKNMALTKFCHMHILCDSKQKLYKPCNFSIKSSTTGPIRCGKPILRSIVPAYCASHFVKAENHMVRALKKAGLSVSSTSKVTPKFHVMVAESVRQIKNKRKAAQQANLENAGTMDENGY